MEGDTHFQYACAAIATTHPAEVMALKSHKARDLDLRSVWLLDNQSTFDLCCNPDFAHKRRDATRQCTCQVIAVDFGFPRNVQCLVMISGFGSLNRQ